MSEDAAVDALAGLRAAVDVLLDTDFDGVDEAGLTGLLEAFEVQRRRIEAVDVRLLAAVDRAHVAARHCRTSPADLLVHLLRLSPGEARARVRRARDLGPRRTLQGEPLEPIHPQLSRAQRDGAVSTQQLDVAARVLEAVPADISLEATPAAEALLVQAAAHQGPRELARTGTMLLERLDPDGAEPNDERVHARRALRLHRRRDGSWTLTGELTDEAGHALQTVLDPLTAPAPATPVADADGRDGTGDTGGINDTGGIKDTGGTGGVTERDRRTAAERAHDALLELCTRVLRSGTLPDAGGVPVTVVVRADAADLGPDGMVQSEHGHLLRLRTLQRLAGDAALVPVLFDRVAGECRLFLGRTRRLANRAQRRVLAVRDGGCCFPGCTRPASWCEVHHVLEWLVDLGPTDIDNLCLLCAFHHREFARRGWRVDMVGGLPQWTPPSWLDPRQRPVRNTAHHLPEITFTADGAMTARLRR